MAQSVPVAAVWMVIELLDTFRGQLWCVVIFLPFILSSHFPLSTCALCSALIFMLHILPMIFILSLSWCLTGSVWCNRDIHQSISTLTWQQVRWRKCNLTFPLNIIEYQIMKVPHCGANATHEGVVEVMVIPLIPLRINSPVSNFYRYQTVSIWLTWALKNDWNKSHSQLPLVLKSNSIISTVLSANVPVSYQRLTFTCNIFKGLLIFHFCSSR